MQVDGFSLEGQITRMKTFAEREEMDIVKRYCGLWRESPANLLPDALRFS